MKFIVLLLSVLTSQVVFCQYVHIHNDSVYRYGSFVGTIKKDMTSLLNVNEGSDNETYYVLQITTPQSPEIIKEVRKDLSRKYGHIEVKHISDTDKFYRAGQAMKSSSNYQIMVLASIPLTFINPIFGGVVSFVGIVGSISENHKAGSILAGEL